MKRLLDIFVLDRRQQITIVALFLIILAAALIAKYW